MQGDEKYRPLTVLLAVLYKLQVRNDTFFTQSGTKVFLVIDDWLIDWLIDCSIVDKI